MDHPIRCLSSHLMSQLLIATNPLGEMTSCTEQSFKICENAYRSRTTYAIRPLIRILGCASLALIATIEAIAYSVFILATVSPVLISNRPDHISNRPYFFIAHLFDSSVFIQQWALRSSAFKAYEQASF